MTANGIDQPVEGRFDGREHRFPVRVYFEDTDLSGVVYHANYLRFMERARSDMLRLAGIDQRATLEAGGGAYAVAEMAIRYRRPAKLDDALIVISQLTRVRAAAVHIHQRVMCGPELLADADVTAALVAPDGRPKRQPAEWVAVYEKLLGNDRSMIFNFNLNDQYSTAYMLLHANIVVQIVMVGLLLASIWTWAIIIGFVRRLSGTRRKIAAFETEFWRADDIDAFYKAESESDLPIAKVFSAGVSEWRRSTAGGNVDREGTRERLATAMGAAVANETDKLADRLNILATVGSVAPFVGLFGTVWGIMDAFGGIARAQNTSLAVVAPHIAEALFATGIGLFAAIPAVIAYNRFSHGVNKIEARLNRFADGFHATLSRQLEAKR